MHLTQDNVVSSTHNLAAVLRLARHHLVDDHDPLSREWAAVHMRSVIDALVSQGVIRKSLPLQNPTAKDLWDLYTELEGLLQPTRNRVQRRLPIVLRDLGIVSIALMALGVSFRKYHHLPINLWSNRYELMDLSVENSRQGYGILQVDKTVEKAPIVVNGVYYPVGLGTHADSRIDVSLTKQGKTLVGQCGYPDSAHGGAIRCHVEANGRELFKSGVLDDDSRLATFEVPIEGVDKLALLVSPAQVGITADHAVWVDMKIRND
ncbi:MAG: NPCBM/NEW2 domain-containing protein [Deltaproteobacteria bacterium]|nr:NPCBM/NEW2 domain-containing protein [Deltaproteobacteria bacterium]